MNLTLKFSYIVKNRVVIARKKYFQRQQIPLVEMNNFYIENPGSMQTRHQDTQYIEFNQRVHTRYDIKQQFTRIIVIWNT